MLVAVGGFALASSCGFYVGWRLAWALDLRGGYLVRRVGGHRRPPTP